MKTICSARGYYNDGRNSGNYYNLVAATPDFRIGRK